jgi:mono/diheme cytochrome c family protein
MRFMSRNRLLTLILLFVVFVLSSLLVPSVRSQSQVSQPEKSSRAEEPERALILGKRIFVEKCARCHAEAGDKPLQSGLPLNQRDLSAQDITKFVSGRLKDAPDEEKRAVALYVQSIMKRK